MDASVIMLFNVFLEVLILISSLNIFTILMNRQFPCSIIEKNLNNKRIKYLTLLRTSRYQNTVTNQDSIVRRGLLMRGGGGRGGREVGPK